LLARDLGWEELLTFSSADLLLLSLVLSSDLEDREVRAFFADGVRFLRGDFLFKAAYLIEKARKNCFAISISTGIPEKKNIKISKRNFYT
jgi:hypothetical protein